MAKLSDDTILFSKNPATFSANKWLDASITGNGRVGAALTGGWAVERILINDARLTTGGHTGVLQDVSDKFPLIRKHYNDGKVFDAAKVLESEFAKRNYKPEAEKPMPLAVLGLDFIQEGLISNYSRITDMESSEITVEYRANADTTFTRQMFVGRSTDTICYNVSRSGTQKINVNISLENFSEKLLNPVLKFECGYIFFAARGKDNQDYGLVARLVIPNGSAAHLANGIIVREADSLTILAKAFVGGNREAKFKELKTELMSIKHSYAKLQSANQAIHKRLFGEATLKLTDNSDVFDISTLTNSGVSPKLLVRMWNFAKYIVICGYGELIGTTGLWCGEVGCARGISFNNTAQLLYSGAVNCFSEGAVLNLFSVYEKFGDDLKKNATRVYGARGYFVPDVISPGSALFGSVDAKTLHFVASAALSANLFYSYFLTTGDIKILKSRIFPFMLEVFAFYSDFLKLDNNGFYSTIPSYSPNSTPGNVVGGKPLEGFSFAINSTIDFLAVDALLDNLIHAASILGGHADEAVWHNMRAKIPPFSVSDKGTLREYTNSAFIDGVVNCGNMHGYGLWPLKTFSFRDQVISYKPAVGTIGGDMISLAQASANAAHLRIRHASHVQQANTLAVYAVQLAHNRDVLGVNSMLERLTKCLSPSAIGLTNDFRGSGFTHSNRPQIDISVNMGFATAISECLIQSNHANLRVLPVVLPSLTSGSVTGIVTDFAATVSMDWDVSRGRLFVKIMPKQTCKIDIFFNRDFKKLKSKDLKLDSENALRGIQLNQGKAISFEFA